MIIVALRWAMAPLLVSVALGPMNVSAQFAVLEEPWRSPTDCGPAVEPIRMEALDEVSFVLRESPCIDREAPFIYLLIGTQQALLVDSGTQDGVLLAEIVGRKLAENSLGFAALTVAHTHSHWDHRGGDAIFADAGARVVGPTVDEVREFWNLEAWPEGVALMDLGDRIIEVLPLPGHNDNSIGLFDHRTRALLSGDTILRGKINVADLRAFRHSMARLSRFVDRVDARVILGGHLERDNLPLGLAPATVADLASLSKRVNFVRPFASADHFTVVYLKPVLVVMGGGFLLLIGLSARHLLAVRRRRTQARTSSGGSQTSLVERSVGPTPTGRRRRH